MPPLSLPDAPRPPSLPELTHPTIEITQEASVGSIGVGQVPPGVRAPRLFSFVNKLSAELPLAPGQFYLGMSYLFCKGDARDVAVPPSIVSGNLELNGRGVWASTTGLTFGGSFGLVLPLTNYDPSGPEIAIAAAAAALRAWDTPLLAVSSLTLRPAVDVRSMDGPWVIQFRQGLDFIFSTHALPVQYVAGVSTLYVGYHLARVVSTGLEASEYYLIQGARSDVGRVSFYLGPSVAYTRGPIRPSLSLYRTIGTPLDSQVDNGIGIRLLLSINIDTGTPTVAPAR